MGNRPKMIAGLAYFYREPIVNIGFSFFFLAKVASYKENGEPYSYVEIFEAFRAEFGLTLRDFPDDKAYRLKDKVLRWQCGKTEDYG